MTPSLYALRALVIGICVCFGFQLNAQQSTAHLSVSRFSLSATSVGEKILFAGGIGSVNSPEDHFYSTVDIYHTSTSTWTVDNLSAPRGSLAAASSGTKAFFGGGFNRLSGKYLDYSSSVVDIYDATGASWTTTTLSVARQELAATSLNGFVFFGG